MTPSLSNTSRQNQDLCASCMAAVVSSNQHQNIGNLDTKINYDQQQQQQQHKSQLNEEISQRRDCDNSYDVMKIVH